MTDYRTDMELQRQETTYQFHNGDLIVQVTAAQSSPGAEPHYTATVIGKRGTIENAPQGHLEAALRAIAVAKACHAAETPQGRDPRDEALLADPETRGRAKLFKS